MPPDPGPEGDPGDPALKLPLVLSHPPFRRCPRLPEDERLPDLKKYEFFTSLFFVSNTAVTCNKLTHDYDGYLRNHDTTLQSMVNAKLSKQRF